MTPTLCRPRELRLSQLSVSITKYLKPGTFVTLSVAVIKYFEKSSPREEGLILAHRSRMGSTLMGSRSGGDLKQLVTGTRRREPQVPLLTAFLF